MITLKLNGYEQRDRDFLTYVLRLSLDCLHGTDAGNIVVADLQRAIEYLEGLPETNGK